MSDIRIIDPVKDERWDKFVEKHQFGWLYHLSGWKIALEKSFNHMQGHYLTLFDNDVICAALPIYEVNSWITKDRLVSIPFASLSDPLISSASEMEKLFAAVLSIFKNLHSNYIEIRTFSAFSLIQNSKMGFNRFFKHHYLQLGNSLEQLEKKFHRTCVRQRIARALDRHIELKVAEDRTDLKDFFQLYLITRKRLGLPPQPFIFFESLWETFHPKGMIKILLAIRNNQTLAGLLLFKFKYRVSAEVAAFNKKFGDLSPLHLLFWESIKSAYEEGYSIFDFGRTSPYNTGLMNFKRRWGTEMVDLPYLYYPKEIYKSSAKKEKSVVYKLIKNICYVSPMSVFQNLGKFLYNHMG